MTETMAIRPTPDPAAPRCIPSPRDRQGIVLLTTCDLAGGRSAELLRLLGSVQHAMQAAPLTIRHYILLQRAPGGPPAELLAAAGDTSCVMAIGDRVSLSRARNLLLCRARQEGALSRALWVAFPDDDAWYPQGVLAEVNGLFSAHGSLALVTCRYGADPVPLQRGAATRAFRPLRGYGDLVRVVSSNTLMVRASVVEAVGGFDERLGVGARINGGEDLDYALRALARGNGAALVAADPLIGHRDRMPWVRSRYFAGSLFALARAARSRPRLTAQMLRKLAVGVSLLALRELSARELREGIRAGLGGWFTPAPAISLPDREPVHPARR
ncbi:hypothetical protein NCCP691_28660 [Noviherbaspirillum aridicola]|uniref:Uncharacterized protein n=2 Tax=Noviherbaspirillum aridicola TaxID=2849687 RepID=A0ABQ4Q7F0_9BURK|nr:hypothetical protein NCCP691_28660 [Noviherbaspirillum aridicola]